MSPRIGPLHDRPAITPYVRCLSTEIAERKASATLHPRPRRRGENITDRGYGIGHTLLATRYNFLGSRSLSTSEASSAKGM